MPNWWDAYENNGAPASAPAQSPWQSFVSAITNRDWGQTLGNVAAGAAHGGADIASMLEGTLNNPLTNPSAAASPSFTAPGTLNDLATLLMGRKTPVANTLHAAIPQVNPQDKGDIYAGRAAEGAVAGLPFGGIGALAGAGSGVGGQAGHDVGSYLAGGEGKTSQVGDLLGQVVGGAVPLAPHTITSIRGAKYIRAGMSQPDLPDALAITAYSESRFNPAAVSPKGAKGEMQVMDATARDPGHGIRPSDGTPADTARVGRQLFTALLGKYDGDYGKAWAAYNWGEGHIDKFGDNWYEHAPEETRKYVNQNLKLLGRTAPSAPTPDVSPEASTPAPGADFAAQDARLMSPAETNLRDIMAQRESLVQDLQAGHITPEEYDAKVAPLHAAQTAINDHLSPESSDNVSPFPDNKHSVNQAIDDHITEMEDMVKTGNHDVTPDEIAQLRNEIIAPFEKAGVDLPPEIQHHADRLDVLYRQVGMDSSHEKFTGYPKDNFPANDPREPVPAPPGKTLHEFTDPEWNALSEVDKKRLIDEANDKIFNPVPPEGKTLHEYSDEEWKKLNPYQRQTLIDQANEKVFHPEGRDTPPAQSGNFGTRVPESVNRKPPTKSPEGHEPDGENLRDSMYPNGPALKQNRRRVIDKLADAITQTNPMRKEAADMLRQERAKRLAAVYRTRGTEGGEAGFYKELKSLQGSMGRPTFESIRHWFSQPEVDHLYNMINDSSLSGYETIKAKTALNKLLGADYGEVPTQSEIKLLQQAIPLKGTIWKQLLDNEEGSLHLPEGAMKVADAVNFTRTMRASFDLSAPFRQGVFMVGSKAFWKNIPEMVKMFGNPKYFEQEMRRIRLDPDYEMAKEAKLAITDVTNAQLQEHEEAFMSRFAGMIPGVKMSERAYTGFLNKLRFDTFKSYMSLARKGGIPLEPKRVADMGRFINSATGRGDLGKYGNMAAPFLSGGLFSPRLMASRINLLNPVFYAKLDPFVRKQAMKSLFSFTLMAGTTLGLLKASGAKVDTDWRHPGPDLGKAVIGNTHVDVLGGFQQYIRFGLELMTGMQKSQNGNVKQINKEHAGPFDPTYASVASHFLRSKLAPIPSLIADYANDKKDFLGQPMSVSTEMQNLFVPMALQDIHDAYKQYGPMGAAAVADPDLLGMGVNTYSPKPSSSKSNFGFGKSFKDPFSKEFGSQFPKEFK